MGNGCQLANDPGLAAFEGGFDPIRYDAGPLAAADAAALPGGRALRFVVPTFYEPRVAAGAVSALEHALEQGIGLDVEVLTPSAYGDVADALARGDVDVADFSPYQLALALQRAGGPQAAGAPVIVVSTVAHGASSYGSYIVVRQGSPIDDVGDLKGKRIAFVDPTSTSGWLLPATYLRNTAGFDLARDVHVVFAGSHPAAVDAVQSGAVDAAALSSDLLIGRAGLAGPLVVVAKAGRMPYDVIVARGDLDERILARLRATLLRLSIHDAAGRNALRAFSSVDGFMPTPAGHYDEIIRLAKQPPPIPANATLSLPSPTPAPTPAP